MIDHRRVTLPANFGVRPRQSELDSLRAERAIASLKLAATVARGGDHHGARELCAAVLFEILPLVRHNRELLRWLLHALLLAQGFRLLSHVGAALGGRRICFVLLPDAGGEVTPPRCEESEYEVVYTVDPRWLAQLAAVDPFVLALCEGLATGGARYQGRRSRVAASLIAELA
jgi:hypothetical protein